MFFQRKKIGFLLEAIILSTVVGFLIPIIYVLKGITMQQHIPWNNFLVGFAYSFVVTFCIYFFNVQITHKFQQIEHKFPSHLIRIILEQIVTNLIAAVVISIISAIYMRVFWPEISYGKSNFFDNILIAAIVNTIAVFIIEALFFFKKWKNSIIESEQLRRKNVEIQYAALTSQVNPHFLFNSLNALCSLIQADPEKAVTFTREFSKIYRYVLDSKDRFMVTLQEELDFLYSFLYLQKIRFDKGLNYTIEVEACSLDLFLPPLSLQLLIENAIKHNEISEDHPLNIQVTARGKVVTVSNNYRPARKTTHNKSGIGLKNLKERYEHYTDIAPEFFIEDKQYIAKIPLLKDE
jgi:two-component system, LytTR family, sensor kinase